MNRCMGLINVTRKRDVNGNSYYRCKMNQHHVKPLTIRNAYSEFDAARCFIGQRLNHQSVWSITGEGQGFDDSSCIFVVEEAK